MYTENKSPNDEKLFQGMQLLLPLLRSARSTSGGRHLICNYHSSTLLHVLVTWANRRVSDLALVVGKLGKREESRRDGVKRRRVRAT